ncbi:MAG: flagellar hook capping FlgD N-terminal domain-containing protein [Gemmobacter sp.]
MQISADATPATAPPRRTPDAGRAGTIGADFQTFLRMLTTQLQNQDPLNPMEASDFAVQLATFAGVEQQTRTNQLLERLGGFGGGSLGQLAGWIGMEARVAGPAQFDGTPLALAIAPAPRADGAVLVVRDAAGREVVREAVPLDDAELDWAGVGPDGTPLPPGRYNFTLESRAGETVIASDPVPVYAAVTEARRRPDGGIEIVLSGGITAAADSVSALRRGPG